MELHGNYLKDYTCFSNNNNCTTKNKTTSPNALILERDTAFVRLLNTQEDNYIGSLSDSQNLMTNNDLYYGDGSDRRCSYLYSVTENEIDDEQLNDVESGDDLRSVNSTNNKTFVKPSPRENTSTMVSQPPVFEAPLPSFQRNCRFTQSCMTQSAADYAEKNGVVVPSVNLRQSLAIREKQLYEWTKDYSEEIEAIIKETENLKRIEVENQNLVQENLMMSKKIKDLERLLQVKDREIEYQEKIHEEQRKELMLAKQSAAFAKSETDKVKVENMIHNNILNTASVTTKVEDDFHELQEKYRELNNEMKLILKEAYESQNEFNKLQTENNQLRRCLMDYQIDKEQQLANDLKPNYVIDPDNAIDSRSKSELLSVIRQQLCDNVIWENYAFYLLKRIIENAPHILDVNFNNTKQLKASNENDVDTNVANNNNHKISNDDYESRWEVFSLSLVENINKIAPHLLSRIHNISHQQFEQSFSKNIDKLSQYNATPKQDIVQRLV